MAFILRHLLLPLVVCAALLAATSGLGWDLALSDRFFEPSTETFPLRHDFLFQTVLHDLLRHAPVVVGLSSLALLAASPWYEGLASWRRPLAYAVLSMALSAGTVALLKDHTNLHCPWSIERYGGQAPHRALSDLRWVPTRESGHCWPSGHAAGGFSLLAFYFVARERRPRLAAITLAAVLGLGLLLSWTQIVRGAHFLSHNLWSLTICWTVAATLALALRIGVDAQDPATSPGHGSDGT